MAIETRFFDPDGPVREGFDLIVNLIFLNFLTIVCCIPVITIGASFTALHYTALKLVRHEDAGVAKLFFRSFKENLKPGIGASFIMIIVGGFLGFDLYATTWIQGDPFFVKFAIALLTLLAAAFVFTATFFFPVQAKLVASLKQNIVNAFKMALSHFGMTILMVVLNFLPFVACYYFFTLLAAEIQGPFIITAPLLFVFGLSVPAYFDAKLYNRIFLKLEGKEDERKDI